MTGFARIAAQTLGEIGPDAKAALFELTGAVNDKSISQEVRASAIEALGKILRGSPFLNASASAKQALSKVEAEELTNAARALEKETENLERYLWIGPQDVADKAGKLDSVAKRVLDIAVKIKIPVNEESDNAFEKVIRKIRNSLNSVRTNAADARDNAKKASSATTKEVFIIVASVSSIFSPQFPYLPVAVFIPAIQKAEQDRVNNINNTRKSAGNAIMVANKVAEKTRQMKAEDLRGHRTFWRSER